VGAIPGISQRHLAVVQERHDEFIDEMEAIHDP
jgi:hypothetical protein